MSTYVAKHPFHTAAIVIITLAISVNTFAFTFTDSFTGTAINSDIWTSGQSAGDTVTFNTTSGTVDMYQGTTTGSASLSFLYALTGDFVIEADYTAANWDLTGMDQQRIGIMGSQSSNYISVQRVSDWWFGGEIYLTYENGSSWNSGSPTTTDTQGRIRLVRTGSDIKGYYWDKAANGGLGRWACVTQDSHPISFSGPFSFSLCIWSGYNGTQIGNVISWDNVSVTSNGIVSDAGSMDIQKCTVAAGKPLDSISFSGTLDATEADFTLAMGDVVEVGIESDLMAGISFQFPITDATFKKGKFKDSESFKGSTYGFSYDAKKGTMAFSAKNVNLTGLACPAEITISIGSYKAEQELTETIINGAKPCPSILMMGVQNSLDVTKFVPKAGKTTNSDSFTAQGTFRISGQFDLSQPFILTLGSQQFTVPGNLFKQANGVVSCTNAPASQGGLVSAKFDTYTGAFTIAVKKTFIENYGDQPFDLSLFGIFLGGLYTADLGPQQIFSLENELRHFNIPTIWNFTPFGYNIISGLSGGSTYYSRFNDEDTLYWQTNDQGTSLKGASLSGDFFDCDIDVDVLTNPPLLRIGQPFTSQANFIGSLDVWVPDNSDIDVDISNFAGTVKITTKAVKWETVSAMGGTYTALKIEQTFALSATTLNVYVDDPSRGSMDTTGVFTSTYKLTYWCEPSIGVIKLIDTGHEKVTARGAGSLAHNWNTAYTLTNYLR